MQDQFLKGILHSLDNHQVFQNPIWYEKINKSLFKSKDKIPIIVNL